MRDLWTERARLEQKFNEVLNARDVVGASRKQCFQYGHSLDCGVRAAQERDFKKAVSDFRTALRVFTILADLKASVDAANKKAEARKAAADIFDGASLMKRKAKVIVEALSQ